MDLFREAAERRAVTSTFLGANGLFVLEDAADVTAQGGKLRRLSAFDECNDVHLPDLKKRVGNSRLPGPAAFKEVKIQFHTIRFREDFDLSASFR